MMTKLGYKFTEFPIMTHEIKMGDSVFIKDVVMYKDRECIVVREPIRIGSKKEVMVRLNTNDPEDYIPVYDASEIDYLSPIGIEVRKPIVARHSMYSYHSEGAMFSKDEMLQEKYKNLDLPEGFTIEEMQELDKYVEELRQ